MDRGKGVRGHRRARRPVREGHERPDRGAPRRKRRAAGVRDRPRFPVAGGAGPQGRSALAAREDPAWRAGLPFSSCAQPRRQAGRSREDDRLRGAAERHPSGRLPGDPRRRGRARERAVRDLLRPRLRRRADGRRAVAGAPIRRGAARAGSGPRRDPADRRRPDLPLRRGVGRPDADPHRRGVRRATPGCRGSSPTGSACWRSRRGRSFESSANPTSAGCAGSRCASRSRSCPGRRSARALWSNGDGAAYAFETTVDGTVVLRDGLAELAGAA